MRTLALAFALLFVLFGSLEASTIKRSAEVMGTELEITFSGVDDATADEAFGYALDEFRRIDRELSEWREGSLVTKINRNAGKNEPVKVTSELFAVISAAMIVSELTEGAFDISWASMWGTWNFTRGEERIPSEKELKEKLRLVNYKDIKVDDKEMTVSLARPGMAIGLGGIAKGFAVDNAMQVLAAMGVENAIIKAGGDMRVQGTEDGKPWEVGIKHPRDKKKLLAKLPLANISISTSGDYERFFVRDGVLYHHIIDPKTGYPARGCRSVTILALDTMTTDALSTAVFILGPEKGLKLVESLRSVEAIIVDSEGAVHTSTGIQSSFK